jgi:hypothetical protein
MIVNHTYNYNNNDATVRKTTMPVAMEAMREYLTSHLLSVFGSSSVTLTVIGDSDSDSDSDSKGTK